MTRKIGINDVIERLPDYIQNKIVMRELYPPNEFSGGKSRNGSGCITFKNGIELSVINDGYGSQNDLLEVAVFTGMHQLNAQIINKVSLDGEIIDTVAGWHTLNDVIALATKVSRITADRLDAEFEKLGGTPRGIW